MVKWGEHVLRVGSIENLDTKDPESHIEELRKKIEPWLSAVLQSEHLSLLVGSGLTTAIAKLANASATDMSGSIDNTEYKEKIKTAAMDSAKKMKRGAPNIEDYIRVSHELLRGLQILEGAEVAEVKSLSTSINTLLQNFLKSLLKTEREILKSLSNENSEAISTLVSFLLSFSSRTATRERLHIFTTNYDRLIEFGADLAGLHLVDRFVGSLEPVFRSSRLDIDLHYNPPGIRGEPRYLEGVVRYSKIHGSLDWSNKSNFIRRVSLPFGAEENYPEVSLEQSGSVMIYPNSSKDRETAEYPYVELFRDYAAAICKPNSVLVTYGYGFGDEHINRVISDMLTIPSTHLVIISYNDNDKKIENFCQKNGRSAQISLLIGRHYGDILQLVNNYLPKPAIDRITIRQTELLKGRGLEFQEKENSNNSEVVK